MSEPKMPELPPANAGPGLAWQMYTADQMRAYALQVAEEAARVCLAQTTHKDDPDNCVWQSAYNHVANDCAAAIRARFGLDGEKR